MKITVKGIDIHIEAGEGKSVQSDVGLTWTNSDAVVIQAPSLTQTADAVVITADAVVITAPVVRINGNLEVAGTVSHQGAAGL